jgi:hypothetical protein
MTTERKTVRLNAAARRMGVQPAYLSRIAKPGGILERDDVTVIRYPHLPDVVEFYQNELFAWWHARHPEWEDPGET